MLVFANTPKTEVKTHWLNTQINTIRQDLFTNTYLQSTIRCRGLYIISFNNSFVAKHLSQHKSVACCFITLLLFLCTSLMFGFQFDLALCWNKSVNTWKTLHFQFEWHPDCFGNSWCHKDMYFFQFAIRRFFFLKDHENIF